MGILACLSPMASIAATHVQSLPCPSNINKERNFIVRVKINGDNDYPFSQSDIDRASLRFQETRRPDPLFIDPYAGCLVPHNARMEMKQEVPRYCLATKFIDDKLLSTLHNANDFRQVILLTDGMDTRPYRLNWPRSTIIFDISPTNVFESTTQKLEGVGAEIAKSCMFVHVPAESSHIEEILHSKAFKGTRPSIWAFQGLPMVNLEKLKEILFLISNLAAKGSLVVGELPTWFVDAEEGIKDTKRKWMDKLFMSNGFSVNMIEYDNVARKLGKIAAEDDENILFIAQQLRFSDDQMAIWKRELQRIDGEAEEEGFEEL